MKKGEQFGHESEVKEILHQITEKLSRIKAVNTVGDFSILAEAFTILAKLDLCLLGEDMDIQELRENVKKLGNESGDDE